MDGVRHALQPRSEADFQRSGIGMVSLHATGLFQSCPDRDRPGLRELFNLRPVKATANNLRQSGARLKALLRKAAERTRDALWNKIGEAPHAFIPQECANYFRHAGYEQAADLLDLRCQLFGSSSRCRLQALPFGLARNGRPKRWGGRAPIGRRKRAPPEVKKIPGRSRGTVPLQGAKSIVAVLISPPCCSLC